MKVKLGSDPEMKIRLQRAKRGYYYYQDMLATPPKISSGTPKRQLGYTSVPQPPTSPPAHTVGGLRYSPSNLTTPPNRNKRMRVDTPTTPSRPKPGQNLRHLYGGELRSPLKSKTNIGPMSESLETIRNYSGPYSPLSHPLYGFTVGSGRKACENVYSQSWNNCSYGFTGSRNLESAVSSTTFPQNQKSSIVNENLENEDPVGRDEDLGSDSSTEPSQNETTDEDDLDSTLGLVQKSVTDTAEEDEFADTDTDSASENEFRSNAYYNSPKPVVSINEIPGEPNSSEPMPRLTVSMNFEYEDEFGNKTVRPVFRRRTEDLARKIGTPLDPFYRYSKSEPSTPAQDEPHFVTAECYQPSGSSQRTIPRSSSSGMVSISSNSDDPMDSCPIENQNKMYQNSVAIGPLLKSLPGPQENRIWHWLKHPQTGFKRFSYFDSDQQ